MSDELNSDMDVLDSADDPEEKDPEKTPSSSDGDDNTPPNEDEEEEEKDENEEEEEEQEEEEESEEETPGKLTPAALKKKFPEIYKEFPDLRRVVAQEGEYSKLFSDPEEAKNALGVLQSFSTLGDSIVKGDPAFLLKEVHKEDPETFERLASNFLPAVYDTDPKVFNKVVVPLFRNAFKKAIASGDKNKELAAKHMAQFLSIDLNAKDSAPSNSDEVNRLRQEFEERERRASAKAEKIFADSTINSAKSKVMALIKKDLDPEKAMNPRVFEAAAKDIFDRVEELLGQDEKHLKFMNALWRKAAEEEYGSTASVRIINALLARVRPLLPSFRQKVREEYLGRRSAKKPSEKKFIPSSGSAGVNKEGRLDPSKVDYTKMTDMDILDDKIVLKK